MTRPYALATNLLQPLSIRVLEDWVDFMGLPPSTLHCFCGGNGEAKATIEHFCSERGIALVLTPDEVCEDVRASEMPVLTWQFSNVEEEYCVLVRLDAFPYRDGSADWLDRCIEVMEAEGFLFATGSVRAFRADLPMAQDAYMKTQRLSNNFIILRPKEWLSLETQYSQQKETFGRFYSEGFLETHCRNTGSYGLRLVNRPNWRVFHVQVWDERMWTVRENFRAGKDIAPFLNGYEDDQYYLWDMYYMHPKPPWLKRMRIELGRLRRAIFAP